MPSDSWAAASRPSREVASSSAWRAPAKSCLLMRTSARKRGLRLSGWTAACFAAGIASTRRRRARQVGGKQDVGADRRLEVGLGDVAGDSGNPVANQVAGDRLRRPGELRVL